MPIDNPALRGTEKGGSRSGEYCLYCYRDGAFVSPDITLEEMKLRVREEMGKRKIDESVIVRAVEILPHLKRWKLVPSGS